MGKIRVLDDQLANQIAAGEVVERPSSVVKELVENAVDAGSTAIDIVIEEGGLASIRVTDNGSGIEADDIETAFQRHATSKISSASDLFRIASLGFRGEALPSIAAVSRLTTVSSQESTGLGRRVVIEGGAVTANEPANAPQGTDMLVKDLFYNTPARLKYMKSIQTELGHISDYVNRIALAHPGIAFTLTHNGNTLLRTLGTGDRLQVIAAVYGSSAAKSMLPVEAETPDYEMRGYISKPEMTRANRNGMTTIVNGRYIRSFVLNQAIVQAYHTLLPINRFPLVVLELGMHPSLLDVNVHPSKMEVRFSKEAELKELVEQAVRAALRSERYIPGPESAAKPARSGPLYVQDAISFHRQEPPASGSGQAAYAGSDAAAPASRPPQRTSGHSAPFAGRASSEPYVPKDAAERLYAPPRYEGSQASGSGQPKPALAASGHQLSSAGEMREPAGLYAAGSVQPEDTGLADDGQPAAAYSEAAAASAAVDTAGGVRANAPFNPAKPWKPAAAEEQQAKERFPELSWIGQMHGTYMIAEAEDGLYLIDQHAAHERINYEYYFHKFGNPAKASQQLLIPLTLEFTPGEALQLQDRLDLFAEAGVEIEPFGAQTFLVRAYPEWFPQGEEKAIIEEMAELVIAERKSIDIAKLREQAAIMCSCKASIKANDRKTREEGEALIARLSNCSQPYTCPHGRPIIVHLSNYQLEKMFKRVMS
ncbi:DNA mismatch repair endonuclease MutL [Paenibacillus protaetiae]|uniref:DNA mismatch repair protein MutL n=1 Tax=Paenibacillus protaetiae TaxID=2509456 RepID=A0A4P6ESG5_9BACL|nr:DNA mismatch repair endonuclease MutL [Paenibacillus protaetiae]QAY66060.1 DNA mismatch repair endonuclease MutL [Paenibacillus protaetiae]